MVSTSHRGKVNHAWRVYMYHVDAICPEILMLKDLYGHSLPVGFVMNYISNGLLNSNNQEKIF